MIETRRNTLPLISVWHLSSGNPSEVNSEPTELKSFVSTSESRSSDHTDASCGASTDVLCDNVYANFVKTGHAGKEAAVPIDFLNFASAVGSASEEVIIACLVRSPIVTP